MATGTQGHRLNQVLFIRPFVPPGMADENQVPWAREGSGFTLMMEALMMLLSAEMPVDAMADLLDEHDTRLWRVLMHYVGRACPGRLERRPADCRR